MPREHREITFTAAELSQALHDYARLQMPEANPSPPRIERMVAEPEFSVVMQFGGERIAYGGAEVTAALIRFAKKIGVPLPRQSRKALNTADNEITLRLWID